MKKNLLQKYFDNSLNDKEDTLLKVLEKKKIYENKDSIFKDDIHEKRIKNEIFVGINSRKENKHVWKQFIRVAAAILVMFGLGMGYNSYKSPTVFSNNLKIPQSYTLPDGSKITLSSGSSISYNDDFNETFRSVKLKGEAFFEVKRNEAKPFRIRTGMVNTEVLGTSFNIKELDKAVKVTVVTGLVKVYDNANEVKIKPQQEATYNTENNKLIKYNVDNDYATSWLKDKYRLNRVNIIQLADFVTQRYGVKLVYADKEIETKRITTTVRKGETIDDFINKINNLEEFIISKTGVNELEIKLAEIDD